MKRKNYIILVALIFCGIIAFFGITARNGSKADNKAITQSVRESDGDDSLHNDSLSYIDPEEGADSLHKGGLIIIDPRDRVEDYVLLSNSSRPEE